MKKYLLPLFAVVFSMAAYGVEIGIDEAIEMSYENHVEIRNMKKTLENYKLQKNEAVKTGLPKVSYSGEYSKIEDLDDEMGRNNVSIEQTLFAGGAIIEGVKVSVITKRYGEVELDKTKKEVKLNVLTIYSDILKYEKNLDTMKNALKELNENYKLAKEQYSLDMVSKTTVLQIKYRVIDLESQILEMENAIAISKMRLKKEIGLPLTEELNLLKEEREVLMAEEINLEKDMEYALENNDDIEMVKIITKLKKSSEVIDRAELLPKIGFTFNYGNLESQELSDSFKNENINWTAGVGVKMTLWDWGKNYDKLKRSKNETVKNKNNEGDVVQEILIGIRSTYKNLFRLQKLIEAKEEAMVSAEENYKLEKEKFAARLITATDFLEAENQLRSSRVDLVNTKSDYYVAYHNYLNIIGR